MNGAGPVRFTESDIAVISEAASTDEGSAARLLDATFGDREDAHAEARLALRRLRCGEAVELADGTWLSRWRESSVTQRPEAGVTPYRSERLRRRPQPPLAPLVVAVGGPGAVFLHAALATLPLAGVARLWARREGRLVVVRDAALVGWGIGGRHARDAVGVAVGADGRSRNIRADVVEVDVRGGDPDSTWCHELAHLVDPRRREGGQPDGERFAVCLGRLLAACQPASLGELGRLAEVADLIVSDEQPVRLTEAAA